MDEHAFVRQVHRRLPSDLHKWKINARYVKGVPDAWYSGPGGDIWVEYKYKKTTPKRRFSPQLSANQTKWLSERHDEGRNVAVIVGCPTGSLILTSTEGEGEGDKPWEDRVLPPDQWTTTDEVARWITAQTFCT